jgi:hypothetical protein
VTQYRNFRDPWGLLTRMVRSKDRAAHAALSRVALAAAATPLDLALRPLERRLIENSSRTDAPLILVVGAPRSGTTLVHQVLANHLPVAYFTNLSSLFPHSTITATRLFKRFLEARRVELHSYYGTTVGLAGPNDAFHVWNRWLGEDRYSTPTTLTESCKAEMRAFFDACFAEFHRPMLSKNNRNTDCVPLLADVFPNAYFVDVRRDPVFTAQSLVLAREQIQGSKFVGWGLGSRDSESGPGATSYIEDVCRQVHAIEHKLDRAKRLVESHRFIEVDYEGFCADPARTVEDVHKRVWGKPCDVASLRRNLRPMPAANSVRIDPADFQRIEASITELYATRIRSLGA